MPAAYPLSLRTVMRDQKTRSQPASFSISQPRRGTGYVEATGTDVPVFWSVTFKFSSTEAQVFWLWFENVIQRGLLEFTLPIGTEFGPTEHVVRFLPDSLLDARQTGDVWEYSATLMARRLVVPGIALEDLSGFVLAEDGSPLSVE